MSKRFIPMLILAAIAMMIFTSSAWAAKGGGADVQKLMQAHACAACHAPTVKKIGPPWSWIAWRYKDAKSQQSAIDEAANFIISGGTGYWEKWTGGIPMPAHPGISEQQAHAIAQWILSQPPAKPPASGG